MLRFLDGRRRRKPRRPLTRSRRIEIAVPPTAAAISLLFEGIGWWISR
ncbi:hypothetical protein [Streptomyces sp. 8N706]